jgi:DNA repair photolyase
MEPRASTPTRRLEAIKQLSAAGIPTAVMFAPVIPALNDHEMEGVLEAARDAGAREAGYVMLRMPLEVRDIFQEWLANAVPGRAQHVMTLIRAMRNGRDYDADWHSRMSGTGPIADMVRRRFELACRKLGLNQRNDRLDTTQFKAPAQSGDQLSLFG